MYECVLIAQLSKRGIVNNKENMKKLLLFVLMLLPMVASAETVEIDGIWYNLVPKGNIAEVTGSRIQSGDIVIPETISFEGTDYTVTKIHSGAFLDYTDIKSLSLPKTIETVGGLVTGNIYDRSPTISIYITDLEAWCNIKYNFSDNPGNDYGQIFAFETYNLYLNGNNLVELNVPTTIESINSYAFKNCENIKKVTIINNVTNIGDNAFENCIGLTSVTIPNSVTSIGSSAFQGCSGLTSVTIGSGVKSIGDGAFSSCSGLTSITIPNSVTRICNNAFRSCTSLTSVTIPNSVTEIDGSAFKGCTGLTSVTIPNSVTSIGELAFANCDNLEDVYCNAEIVPNTSTDAFDYSYIEYATLHVPATSVNSYKTTEPWSKFKKVVSISETPHTLKYVIDDEDYETFQLYEGDDIIPLDEPTKEGYTFSGWSEIPETMPAKDVVVTGTFTINKYKLTYKVDDVEYKTSEIEYGATITPEPSPTKEGYTFSGWSEIPEKMPANDVTITGTFTFIPLGKCATPSISMKDGNIFFECETEGVEYVPQVIPLNETSYSNGEMQLPNKYRITVYATKEQYENSDMATKDIELSLGSMGDVNGDGKVNVADHVKLSDIIMNK